MYTLTYTSTHEYWRLQGGVTSHTCAHSCGGKYISHWGNQRKTTEIQHPSKWLRSFHHGTWNWSQRPAYIWVLLPFELLPLRWKGNSAPLISLGTSRVYSGWSDDGGIIASKGETLEVTRYTPPLTCTFAFPEEVNLHQSNRFLGSFV